MGLDMYLLKGTKVAGATIEDYLTANNIAAHKQDMKTAIKYGYPIWTQYDFDSDDVKRLHSILENTKLNEFYGDIQATISEEVAYWRKANHIHNWFVQNLQDGVDECQYVFAEEDDLRCLLALCNEVFDKKDDVFSKEKLPCVAGFFFGDVEYNEFYYSAVEETIEMLEKILELTNFEEEFILYTSSW